MKSISPSKHSLAMDVNLTVEEDFVFYRFLALFKVYTKTPMRKAGPSFDQLPSRKVLNKHLFNNKCFVSRF